MPVTADAAPAGEREDWIILRVRTGRGLRGVYVILYIQPGRVFVCVYRVCSRRTCCISSRVFATLTTFATSCSVVARSP